MWDVVFYLLAIVALGAAAAAALYFGRGLIGGDSPAGFFGPKTERRIDVVEHSSVDGRRRLVLIRRDDVEHLIMTGGPVDVVIETNIEPRRARAPAPMAPAHAEPAQPVFSRAPRSFGAVGGE